jgi:hypothetical protein
MSPFKATLGFEPTTPTTVQFNDTEPAQDLPERVRYLQELHRFAVDCVTVAQARMQSAANKKRLPVPFRVGDKVKLKAGNLRFLQQPCAKLRDRYVGPFEITEALSPVAFRIKLPPGVRIHDVVHASMLEKWFQDKNSLHDLARAPMPNVHDAKRFDVESIMDVAYNCIGTGLLFKVRWAYPYNVPSEDTWEPLRSVQHLTAFETFIKSPTFQDFVKTPDFTRFRNRWPQRVPKTLL